MFIGLNINYRMSHPISYSVLLKFDFNPFHNLAFICISFKFYTYLVCECIYCIHSSRQIDLMLYQNDFFISTIQMTNSNAYQFQSRKLLFAQVLVRRPFVFLISHPTTWPYPIARHDECVVNVSFWFDFCLDKNTFFCCLFDHTPHRISTSISQTTRCVFLLRQSMLTIHPTK